MSRAASTLLIFLHTHPPPAMRSSKFAVSGQSGSSARLRSSSYPPTFPPRAEALTASGRESKVAGRHLFALLMAAHTVGWPMLPRNQSSARLRVASRLPSELISLPKRLATTVADSFDQSAISVLVRLYAEPSYAGVSCEAIPCTRLGLGEGDFRQIFCLILGWICFLPV